MSSGKTVGGAVAAALIIFALTDPGPAAAQIPEPLMIEGGAVTGTPSGDAAVRAYRGIPFAAPPVGSLRWRPPQPAPRWQGVRAADRAAPICPQLETPPDALYYSHREAQSEDCLYLNIWTPAHAAGERLPVMVWIYGGGYRAGSAGLRMYDGTAMAGRGVVFVTIAYRVGALGFLAHPALSAESPRHVSGNYGLLDQIAALDWIGRNIDAFGGDPGNVTILGQSAGSMSVSFLAGSPLATGRFHRGIGETGAGMGRLAPGSLAAAEERGAAFTAGLGARTAQEMRAIDSARLVEAAGPGSGAFEPNIDGWVLPASLAAIYAAGRQNDVPLMLGSNSEESRAFPQETAESFTRELTQRYGDADAARLLALHPALTDAQARQSKRQFMTIAMGDLTMRNWARAQAGTGRAPVYRYRFTRHAPVPAGSMREQATTPDLGAFHGSEIVYALDNLAARDWPWTEGDRALARTMTGYWINFARTGDPNGPGLPHWPTLAQAPDDLMELGDHVGLIPAPYGETLDILARHHGLPAVP